MDSNSDFDREYDLLKEQLDRADELRKSFQSTNSSASNITVNAGGVGLWVAITCALVSSLMAVIVSIMFIYVLIKTDRIGDYQAVIYQQLPEIRELLEKKK